MRFNFAIVSSAMLALLPKVLALHDHHGRVQRLMNSRSAVIQGTGATNFDEEQLSKNTSANQSPPLHESITLPNHISAHPEERDADNQNRTQVLAQLPPRTKTQGQTAEHNQTQVPMLMQVEQEDKTLPPQDKTQAKPGKNKVVLAILEVLGLGFFGIDRMYLGGPNIALGIAKLLTLAGLGVWGVVDAFTIFINCIQREPSIHAASMHYDFDPSGIETAHALGVLGLVMLVVPMACCCCVCLTGSITFLKSR